MPDPMIPEPTTPTRLTVMGGMLPIGSFARRPARRRGNTARCGSTPAACSPRRLVSLRPGMAEHRMFAAFYERMEPKMEASGLRRLRTTLLRQARGRVLDVGGGIGANLDLWPAAVTSVVICEPDGAMRRRLEDRVAFRAPSSVPVEVHPRGVPGLPFPDASFDTVVCTLVLCSVDDLEASIIDLRRLGAPAATLLLL